MSAIAPAIQKKLPSVTQILSPWSDFSMIKPEVLANAADRGTRVHQACAAIAQDLFYRAEDDTAGYIESFKRAAALVDSFIFIEREFVSKTWGYMGHPDMMVRYKGEASFTLWDLKTPRSHQPTWNAQIAAYVAMVEETTKADIGRCGCLRLNPDGGNPIFDEINPVEKIRAWEAFIGSLKAWQYFKH